MAIDKIHPTHIRGIRADRDLGKMLGELRYDVLAEVLGGLKEEILSEKRGDERRGRLRLAAALGILEARLSGTIIALDGVVSLCRKHIDEEKRLRPEV